MKPKWLLETNIFDEPFYDNLIKELETQNIEYKEINYIPFSNDNSWLNAFSENDCVISYGSIQFANKIKREAPWLPSQFYSIEKYDCANYYSYFGDYLLNGMRYIMMPFGDLTRQKEFLFDVLGDDDCIFIRPSKGTKIFTGNTIKKERWAKEYEFLGLYDVQPQEICVVSAPIKIDKEWRFVIANHKPIAASESIHPYSPEVPERVWEYVGEILSHVDFDPDPVWVMDICQIMEHLKVLEIGAFSVAGLYSCDAKEIVKHVNEAALKEWREVNEIL